MIFNLLKLLILWIFSFKEHFNVDFKDYSDKTIGYCKPDIKMTDFNSGNYSTCCWNKMTYEDCQNLNKQNVFCGKNLNTGQPIYCKHVYGKKCKHDPMCFGSCNPQYGLFNADYMIPVENRNVISLVKK